MEYLNPKSNKPLLLATLLIFPSQSQCGIGDIADFLAQMVAVGAAVAIVGGIAAASGTASDATQHTQNLEQRIAELEAQLGKKSIPTKLATPALPQKDLSKSFLPWTDKIYSSKRVAIAGAVAYLIAIATMCDIGNYIDHKNVYLKNLERENDGDVNTLYYCNLKNRALENMKATMTYKLIHLFKKDQFENPNLDPLT